MLLIIGQKDTTKILQDTGNSPNAINTIPINIKRHTYDEKYYAPKVQHLGPRRLCGQKVSPTHGRWPACADMFSVQSKDTHDQRPKNKYGGRKP